MRCRAIVAGLAIAAACGAGDAPAPAGGQRLAYVPADVAYRFAVESATGAGAPIALSARAHGRFRFRSRPDGRVDFLLEAASLSIEGPGMARTMEGDRDHLIVRDGDKTVLELAPGKKSPTGATLDDMFARPMHSLKLAPTGPEATDSDDDHPLVKSGMVDFTAMSVFALPSFPPRPVAIGESWKVARLVPHSVRITQDIPIELEYTLTAVEACDGGHGAKSASVGAVRCAKLAFRGATASTKVTDQGRDASVRYSFSGTSVFAVKRGVVARSDFDMQMDLTTAGSAFPFGAHYELVTPP